MFASWSYLLSGEIHEGPLAPGVLWQSRIYEFPPLAYFDEYMTASCGSVL